MRRGRAVIGQTWRTVQEMVDASKVLRHCVSYYRSPLRSCDVCDKCEQGVCVHVARRPCVFQPRDRRRKEGNNRIERCGTSIVQFPGELDGVPHWLSHPLAETGHMRPTATGQSLPVSEKSGPKSVRSVKQNRKAIGLSVLFILLCKYSRTTRERGFCTKQGAPLGSVPIRKQALRPMHLQRTESAQGWDVSL